MKKTTELEKQSNLKNGATEFAIDVPETATAFSINAKYEDAIASLNVTRHKSITREYLVITSKPEK